MAENADLDDVLADFALAMDRLLDVSASRLRDENPEVSDAIGRAIQDGNGNLELRISLPGPMRCLFLDHRLGEPVELWRVQSAAPRHAN